MAHRSTADCRRHRRRDVSERCDSHCVYCHTDLAEDAPDPAHRPTLDHLVPKSKGGGFRLRNLVLACSSCNRRKGDADPADWLPSCGYPADLRTARAVIAHARRARAHRPNRDALNRNGLSPEP